jgi:hypothetical protein
VDGLSLDWRLLFRLDTAGIYKSSQSSEKVDSIGMCGLEHVFVNASWKLLPIALTHIFRVEAAGRTSTQIGATFGNDKHNEEEF